MLLNLRKSAFILAIILICIGLDQTSKFLAVKYLQPAGRISYMQDTVRLQYIENPGVFLSLGDTLPQSSRFWLFTVVVFLLLAALIVYAYTISLHYRVKIGALALITGGGISNLIDRLTNDGAVVDFLSIGIGTLRTGIFNIADFLIFVGIVLMLIFHRHRRQENGREQNPPKR